MVDGQLYRKGLHSPMMRCLNLVELKYVLTEIHEGINRHGAKALARKALRACYYWPTMVAASKEVVSNSCQKHAKIIWLPLAELTNKESLSGGSNYAI